MATEVFNLVLRLARIDDLFEDPDTSPFSPYYGLHSAQAAIRFRVQAQRTMDLLTAMPNLGARYESEHPLCVELRFLSISKFRNYVIFYRPVAEAIEVVRVLHARRDIHSILANVFGLPEHTEDSE